MSGSLNLARTRLPVSLCQPSRYAVRSFSSTSSVARQGGPTLNPANDNSKRHSTPNVSKTNETPITAVGIGDTPLQENVEIAEERRSMQAPNRKSVWSRSQMPRELAMSGPRFEQTIMEQQPRPYAAIDLIHKQPVRWVDQRMVACDGGGGPLGHPKIFINVDKPQINMCTYCGLPYAYTHHKKYLQSLPKEQLSYPLEATGDAAEIPLPPSPTMKGKIQGQFPRLAQELDAETEPNQPFGNR